MVLYNNRSHVRPQAGVVTLLPIVGPMLTVWVQCLYTSRTHDRELAYLELSLQNGLPGPPAPTCLIQGVVDQAQVIHSISCPGGGVGRKPIKNQPLMGRSSGTLSLSLSVCVSGFTPLRSSVDCSFYTAKESFTGTGAGAMELLGGIESTFTYILTCFEEFWPIQGSITS